MSSLTNSEGDAGKIVGSCGARGEWAERGESGCAGSAGAYVCVCVMCEGVRAGGRAG